MSEVAPATKKKMVVSADQFEDAEEETEDFLGKAGAAVEEAEVKADVKAEEPALVSLASSKVEANKEDPIASSPTAGETPKKAEEVVKVSLPPSPAASSASPKSGTNPLDALASACIAKEQLKVVPQPKTPKEGSKVRAEEISCTDGKLSGTQCYGPFYGLLTLITSSFWHSNSFVRKGRTVQSSCKFVSSALNTVDGIGERMMLVLHVAHLASASSCVLFASLETSSSEDWSVPNRRYTSRQTREKKQLLQRISSS